MNRYPIALELTVWVELGINQYEITIDKESTLSVKRTDDVLHSRELTFAEVTSILEAIASVEMPILEMVNTTSAKASTSYELIIESSHFSVEFNWEDLDVEMDQSESLLSISKLSELVEKLGQFH